MSDQLFETGEGTPQTGVRAEDAPLAVRMRPRDLDELAGQSHLLEPGSALRIAIESGEPHSAIFYGPPGTGKTTVARIIAARAKGAFEELSAVNAGRPEVREVIARARERRASGRPTIFFLDEIHRFNKAQQDALLPAVEDGSDHADRCDHREPVLRGQLGAPLPHPDLRVPPADRDGDRGARPAGASATSAASPTHRTSRPRRSRCSPTRAGGDGRVALAALERAAEATRAAGDSEIGVAAVEDALQRKALLYDREGDKHYDYISAWIKATRGSDVDASIYYLAVMLEGGEDPRFIARRMVIFASEDIGNADPQALLVANAAAQAVDRVGLPECALNLSQAAAYLALAPKSNATTRAVSKASAHVREHGAAEPPPYLQDAHYPGARQLGRGQGYRYPHDEPGGVTDQPLAPESVRGERFYEPTDRGAEAELARAAGAPAPARAPDGLALR